MMHVKFGGVLSRIEEVRTVLRCEGKPVTPNMATTAKTELRQFSRLVIYYEINRLTNHELQILHIIFYCYILRQ